MNPVTETSGTYRPIPEEQEIERRKIEILNQKNAQNRCLGALAATCAIVFLAISFTFMEEEFSR